MLSVYLPINKYVIGLRATLSHPEEEILTLLSFYLSHPSAAVKNPLTSDAHFLSFHFSRSWCLWSSVTPCYEGGGKQRAFCLNS